MSFQVEPGWQSGFSTANRAELKSGLELQDKLQPVGNNMTENYLKATC